MTNHMKYQQVRTQQLEILIKDARRVLDSTTPTQWINGIYQNKYDEYVLEWEEINGRKYSKDKREVKE